MKKIWSVAIILGISLIALFIILFGIEQTALIFDDGFEPYGESNSIITGYNEVSPTEIDTKYWDISINPDSNNPQPTTISGNDFELTSTINKNSIGGYCGTDTITYITTNTFGERDFKTSISGSQGSYLGDTYYEIYLGTLKVHSASHRVSSFQDNIVVSPSPISNDVEVSVNGQEQVYQVSEDYKIKILIRASTGAYSGQCYDNKITILKPSYKSQYGCDIQPNEQYYLQVFNEGDVVSLAKLDRFDKFCLAESPLKIYTNTGSTTDELALVSLVDGESFEVPEGQIWTIEYIGEKSTAITECEQDEVYKSDEGVCLSRTVVSLTCSDGSTFDSERGICVTETEPIEYEFTDIDTHESLSQDGKFRFTVVREDGDFTTPTSFTLFGETFNSLSYGEINIGEESEFNDKISYKVTRFEDHGVEDYLVEYTFSINTDFITLDYRSGDIILNNDWKIVNGGATITQTNNLEETKVYNVDKNFIVGENVIKVQDPSNLEKLKVRPYIIISTPDYDYSIPTENALSITEGEVDQGELEPSVPRDTDEDEGVSPLLIIFIIGGVLLFIEIITFIIRRKK